MFTHTVVGILTVSYWQSTGCTDDLTGYFCLPKSYALNLASSFCLPKGYTKDLVSCFCLTKVLLLTAAVTKFVSMQQKLDKLNLQWPFFGKTEFPLQGAIILTKGLCTRILVMLGTPCMDMCMGLTATW